MRNIGYAARKHNKVRGKQTIKSLKCVLTINQKWFAIVLSDEASKSEIQKGRQEWTQ